MCNSLCAPVPEFLEYTLGSRITCFQGVNVFNYKILPDVLWSGCAYLSVEYPGDLVPHVLNIWYILPFTVFADLIGTK